MSSVQGPGPEGRSKKKEASGQAGGRGRPWWWMIGVLTAVLTLAAQDTAIRALSDAAIRARVSEAYGKLPLHFEANRGQAAAPVKFLLRGSGYTLFLTPTGATLTWCKPPLGVRAQESSGQSRLNAPSSKPQAGYRREKSPVPVKLEGASAGHSPQPDSASTGLRMSLSGANPAPHVTGLEELPGKSHYFIGSDPKAWRTDVPTYAKVQYQEVYPGIDLVFYGNQRQLEYDFVVAPGANPEAIRLAFEDLGGKPGRLPLQIDSQGDLLLRTADGKLILHAPVVYQEINGAKRTVSGRYVMEEPGRVGFQVAAYDPARPLIIDPVLAYSTYLGSDGPDVGFDITVDAGGNAYVTGWTGSTDFPTASPLQSAHGGNTDAFVTKLSPNGSALVYSTYLGGKMGEVGYSIAVDNSGNAYVTGGTTSGDFPLVKALQATLGGSRDAFVAKLSPKGSALVYSTYLGGRRGDVGLGIASDNAGNAYVTGGTGSADFPLENPHPLQETLGGSRDAFVTKLSPDGSALVYSTYLGGRKDDETQGIAVDAEGHAYVTGWTSSTDFPLENPWQETLGGSRDAFVTKLSPDGSDWVYSTYLGGQRNEIGHDIAVDGTGSAYVTGETFSINFPTQKAFPNGSAKLGGEASSDAFVTKLSPDGSDLVYSTYLGGRKGDVGLGIAVDDSGNAYVTGKTGSPSFPARDPLQSAHGGNTDAFVTKLSPDGSALVYSTYLGGRKDDIGHGIAVDNSGNIYVTGGTVSTNLRTTVGVFQKAYKGSGDAFVIKMTAREVEPPE